MHMGLNRVNITLEVSDPEILSVFDINIMRKILDHGPFSRG